MSKMKFEGAEPESRNPQAQQMADESMVRNLAAQAEAIWPQESAFLSDYALPGAMDALDIGCGTGEFSWRLARRYQRARIVGIDLEQGHLELARRRCAEFGERVRFQTADAYELPFEADRFDLTVCRHLLQAIPGPEKVLAEMVRVTKPGGRVHTLSEDYAMIHHHPVTLDTDVFWNDGPIQFAESTGTDLRFGRKTYAALRKLGLCQVDVRYVVVDTQRVPRETFRDIWVAWRDGYSEAIAEKTRFSLDEVLAYWKTMIDCMESDDGYAVWQIPIVTGVKRGG